MLLHLGRGLSSMVPFAFSSIPQWLSSDEYKADDVFPPFLADFVQDRYAANGVQKDFGEVLTFTRSTTGTYFGSNGLLKTAAINEARFDYNPVSLARVGILLEEARTNLFLNSTDMTHADWKVNNSVTTKQASSETDPIGTTTAAYMQEVDTVTSSRYVYQDVACTSGTKYSYSLFVKPQGARHLQIMGGTTNGVFTSNDYANFDLSNELVSVQGSGVVDAGIDILPNGWYRCFITIPAAATANGRIQFNCIASAAAARNASHAGDSATGLHMFGAQVEAGIGKTSYIPTTSASVTRAVDVLFSNASTTVPFANWYNDSAGTLLVSGKQSYMGDGHHTFAEIANGTSGQEQALLYVQDGSNDKPAAVTKHSYSEQSRYEGNVYTAGSPLKMAVAFAVNNVQASIDGVVGTTDTTATQPVTPNRMYIGNYAGLSQPITGHVRCVRYYNIRVSETELQRLTNPDMWENYRVVAKGGYTPIQSSYISGYTRGERRSRVLFGGQPSDEIRLVFWNGFLYQGENNASHPITVEAGLEDINTPQTVMFTFNNGVDSSVTLSQGQWIVTDPIYAADFSLSNFPANYDMRARVGVTVSSGSQGWPFSDSTPEVISGQRTAVSSSGTSQINATGALTTPPGGISNATTDTQCYAPTAIIGKWTGTPDISVLLSGDSIMQKWMDVADDGTIGGAYGVRALRSVNGRSVPHINLARSAERASYYTVAKWSFRRFMMQFCTHMIDNMGINDVSDGDATATTVTKKKLFWADWRRWAKGAKRLAQITINTKTTSTDAWATTVNQTPVSGFEEGGLRDDFNDAMVGLIGASDGVHQVIDIRPVTDNPTEPDKWAVDGTTYYATGDGTHPSADGHGREAAIIKTTVEGW